MTSGATGPAWLFCPGDRPDRFAKAADRADVVILDLEDAVAPDRKDDARRAVAAAADALDPARSVVRVNGAGTPWHQQDVEVLRDSGLTRVMLPKAEDPRDVLSLAGFEVVVLIETPLGVERAGSVVATHGVVGAMWGADDLVAGLGGTAGRFADGHYRDVARYARARVLVAAKAHHRFALDAVHLDIDDLDGLQDECEDAVASGFDGTVAVHPAQVPVIRAAYTPSPERVRWAREVLAAAENEGGVFTFEGRMVDGPVLVQARRVLARTELSAVRPTGPTHP